MVHELRLGSVESGSTWVTDGATRSFRPRVGEWPANIVADAPMGRRGVILRRLVCRVKEDVERVLRWVLCGCFSLHVF